MHINPDHFLTTPEGRLTTRERNTWAWQQCLSVLPEALAAALPDSKLYVLVGAQGSGKSTWAKERQAQEPRCVIFDAILVQRSERAPILAEAQRQGVSAVAVCFHTLLSDCLARNAKRPADEVANEQDLRNVFAAIEFPGETEGFANVLHVGGHDA